MPAEIEKKIDDGQRKYKIYFMKNRYKYAGGGAASLYFPQSLHIIINRVAAGMTI